MNKHQISLDRLVDGELTDEQRRELIAQLADEPDGWRKCALAFLEAQSIRFQLTSWHPSACSGHQQGLRQFSSDVGAGEQRAMSRRPKARFADDRWVRSWTPWLSLAGCALVAFALGRYGLFSTGSPGADRPFPSRPVVSSHPGGDKQAAKTAPVIVTFQPDVDMFVGESAVPRDIEQGLRGMGFDIQRRKGLLPTVDAEGNHIILPFEDVNFVPASRQLR